MSSHLPKAAQCAEDDGLFVAVSYILTYKWALSAQTYRVNCVQRVVRLLPHCISSADCEFHPIVTVLLKLLLPSPSLLGSWESLPCTIRSPSVPPINVTVIHCPSRSCWFESTWNKVFRVYPHCGQNPLPLSCTPISAAFLLFL